MADRRVQFEELGRLGAAGTTVVRTFTIVWSDQPLELL